MTPNDHRSTARHATPAIIAHRGCAGMHPENTLAAVESVVPHVDAVEVDVRRCASGEVVVCHDATVDRVADGTGRVADHTRAELAALDVLGSGVGIPSLSGVLAAIPPTVAVNVELKERGLAAAVRELVGQARNDVILSSFDPTTLETLADPAAAYDTALLFRDDPDEGLETAARLDCDYVHPRAGLCEGTDLVARAARRGFGVNVWTLPDCRRLEEFATLGVDGVIVDRWDE